jgi:DNA-binding protein H-NS
MKKASENQKGRKRLAALGLPGYLTSWHGTGRIPGLIDLAVPGKGTRVIAYARY